MKNALVVALIMLVSLNIFGQDVMDRLSASEELENIVYKSNVLDSFSVTGTGIVTSKPDNVFIQLSISSAPGNNMSFAGKDLDQKVDFIIRSICRDFKLKKESFKITVAGVDMQESTSRAKTASSKYDENGQIIPEKSYSSSMKKLIVINDLGTKSPRELLEIIDTGVKLGAVAINSTITGQETATKSVTQMGSNSAKMALTKGGSAARITPDIKDNNNKLINYHFNEETLKKLMKQAKDGAFKEIKEKMARTKEKLKLNDEEYDFNITEAYNAVSTEDGEVSIKADLSVNYIKQKAAKEPAQ